METEKSPNLEKECVEYWRSIIHLHEQELSLRRQKDVLFGESYEKANAISNQIFNLTHERLKKGHKEKDFANKDYWKYTEVIYKNDPLCWLMKQHPLKTDLIDSDNCEFIVVRYKTIFKETDKTKCISNYKQKKQSQWAPTNLRSIRHVQANMNLNNDSVYCSLGGGDGRDCLTAWHDYHVKKCIYVDNNSIMADVFKQKLLPRYVEKFGSVNIDIICDDMFTQDLSEATHAFLSITQLYDLWDEVTDLMNKLNNGSVVASINWKLKKGFEDIGESKINILDSEIGQFGHINNVYFQKRTNSTKDQSKSLDLADLINKLIKK